MNQLSEKNMRHAKIQLIKNQLWVAKKCWIAETTMNRMRGLIGTRELKPGEGLWLKPCHDIHMWFMSIPIDVVFLKKVHSQDGTLVVKVSSVKENVKPWRLLPLVDWRAVDTLELPVGTIQRCNLCPGDELCIS